jgi:amino acid adenylation domain-containing protein
VGSWVLTRNLPPRHVLLPRLPSSIEVILTPKCARPVHVTGGTVRCLQFSHFTFDVFVQDLFYTWGVGGTIISSTREIMLGSFAELATRANATHAHLTPAFAASVPRERCPTLQVITMIGERLPQAVADDWSRDMRAFNTYGPAETTVVSTFRQFGAAGDEVPSDNIGFPLASVSAFVMRDDQPLMRHGIGELALGGPQLSKGYWNDPERSSGRFVWNKQYSRNLYMTGDLVRQLHDGSLEFIGRTDDMIKIQGIRVELSEISFSLRSCHPLIEQVEIQYLDRQDRPSKVIVAFLAAPKLDNTKESTCQFIASEEAIPIAKSALVEAQNNLPDYMIPSVFLVINSIPRTSSAKTDKAILKEIYSLIDLGEWERTLASNDSNNKEVATWSTRESDLIAIVSELSGASQGSMSRASDLRSFGIDSIAATRLAPMLNAKGFVVSVADILRCQILDDILKVTDKPRTMHPTDTYNLDTFHNEWYTRVRKEIKRSDVFVAPALPLQESLLSESMQNADAYWSHVFLSLDTRVDISRLHEAWSQVVSDTEALRTGFIPSAAVSEHHDDAFVSDSTFMQLIYEEATMDWTCVKSSEAEMKDLATERAHAVALDHQKNNFMDPLLAITIFKQPNHCIMMVSIHHCIRDEASLDFILEDLSKSYQEIGEGSKQRHQLREALQLMLPTKAQIDEDEKFWSKALEEFVIIDGASTWPDLTGKNTRSEDPAAGFITHTRALRTSYKDLQGAAFSLGATSLASILRVAWGSVLLEYLETDSVVFAETWSNRIDDFALADAIGPLTTVLPVPFLALGSAREAVITQSNTQRESRAHRSIHPRFIRKLLGCSENQVLYPAVFNFLPDLREASRNGYSCIWNKVENIVGLVVEHPLALNVAQVANGVLEMEISASQNVVSSAHLAILAQQVDAFVETMLRSPDMPLTQIALYFPKELLSVTSVSFSENVRLAWKQNPTDWVDHYAVVHPHWPAAQVVTSFDNYKCESESWSFAELRFAYKRVAAFISHSGNVNRMIAVCLDRRLEAYSVILGILASGNTYLPIDEDLPQERKSFLLQDSAAAMLFTTRSLAVTFTSRLAESRVIYVGDGGYIEQMVNGHPVEMLSHPQASDNAYLLYTSGSTGLPKGVLVSRGNLCSFIEGLSEFICPLIPGMEELPGKGKYLGLASRAFDVHIAEMFLAWRQGLAAVTAPRTMLLDNLELALRKLRITHASFVPSLIDQAGLDPTNLPDLHYLGVGGEKMSKRVVDTWASNENAALVNAYGPTEMSIGCTAAEVTRESNLKNVGQPYGNSVAHVLVPGSNRYTLRGVAGELCFTGDLVANGYHNRPDAKGFVDDFNGERMYRTGDIVRLMADDTLEYLRREDDQTKVRGQRLELGEISEAIRTSAVTTLGLNKVDVATMVAQHPKLSRTQIVSFVVPNPAPNKAPESAEILRPAYDCNIASKVRAECRKVLPAYMVPDVIIPLTNLPLAPSSGKADTKRLRVLFADIPIADMINYASSEQPNQPESNHREFTEAERSVRSAVKSTLAVDAADILINTNIFRLGLDSLSAISLAIKMQKLGYDCTVSSVLKTPVLEQLALIPQKVQNKGTLADRLTQTRSRITGLESRFRAIHSHGLDDSSIQGVKPCLPLQETLVAISLSNKAGALYINHVALRLSTEIDRSRLHRAWTRVVADHEILRTCFQEFENGIVQVVLRFDDSRSVSWEDIATPDPETASQLQQSESATTIISDIARKAPVRLTLFRPPSDDRNSILLISIHHALYDRASIAMILEELNMRYHSAIPSAHTPFDSMIEYVCSQDQEVSKVFWRDYLACYRPTSIINRADTTNEDLTNNFFSTVDRTLASPLAELEDFSSSISGTLTSTMQAVYGIILAQKLGVHDVVFGAVLSGRTVPIESPHTIVAPCITTIPQRVNLRNDCSTIVDIMKVATQGFVESLEFQHTALRHIHRWLGAEKPLFDCLVSYVQKRDLKPGPYSHLWTELEGSMPNDFPFSIEFDADHEANRMRVHCAFSPAFGDLDRAASLLENIDLLLGALVRRENVTTEDLGISNSDAIDARAKPQLWDGSHWTPRERKMQELAAEICGISAKNISKGASFFSLGIDSITAIRFAKGLRQLRMECSSADVMRNSSIAALVQNIDALPPHINSTETLAEKPHEDNLKHIIPQIPVLNRRDTVTDVYACTPLQSSMLTQTLGSDGRLYFHHHAVRLACHIDLTRLKHAWECLTMETEILRTTFHFSNAANSWLAAVHQECPGAWAERDIRTSLSDSLTDITKHSVFCEEADFEQPPWKTTSLKTATEIVLVISIHHSLYDGVSINLLFQDLARLYEGIDLQPRVPFSDAARAISQSKTDAEEFWLQKLDGFENSEVSPSEKGTATDMMEIETTFKKNSESILRGCKDLGVTIQTVALLAYGKSLACDSGRRDVVFGHVVGGRSLAMPGADEVIGPLFNTVPSRIVFDKTYFTNKTAAVKIQKSSGDSQPHQHASLARIQQAWRQEVGDANAQLFDTLFVFQNTVNKVSSADGLWTSLDIGEAVAPTEYSTNFEFEQGEDEIILRVSSRKGLTTRDQLQVWLAEFEQVFQDILEHPQRSVMAFPSSLQSLPLAMESAKSRPSPQDEIEPGRDLESIRTVLSNISGISPENISVNASIFSLGLDSISAIQVATTCRKQGYGVSVADVLQGRSLGGICRRLRERSPEQNSSMENQSTLISAESRSKALVLANVIDEDVEDVLPCLAGQLYHLANWLRSDRRMCEATWTYQCSKSVNVDYLRSAWRGLRERHSVLRTMFVALSPKEAVQVVLKRSALNDDSFKCIQAPGNSKDSVFDQIKRGAKQPFDFFSPPSKLNLVRGVPHDFIVVKLHHVTYDAWTIQTMVEDLAALYHSAHLPAPPRFESFIHHTMHSLHTEPEKAYWRKSLKNCQQTLLQPSITQSDTPLPQSTTSTPILVSIKHAIANLRALETSCRHSSTSLPTLILLAFARALARHSATTNPTFGLYQAARSASFKGIEQLCAPCLNVTPVVIPDALDQPTLESVQRLQCDLAERVEFEQSYLHEVLDWVGCGGKPLFNTFVNILSHEGARPTSAVSSTAITASSDPLFVPCQLGDIPMDIAPAEEMEYGKTAVDALDVGFLAEKNLYLDVVRSTEDDCVDFAIKCDGELMDEGMVRSFAGEIAGEVEKIVEVIGRKEV